MDRTTAEKLTAAWTQVLSRLNDATVVTEEIENLDERRAVRLIIFDAASIVNDRALVHIAREFPDLHPDFGEEWHQG